jgi:hypothetical protein
VFIFLGTKEGRIRSHVQLLSPHLGSRLSPKASEIVSGRKRKAPTLVLNSDEEMQLIPNVAEEKQDAEEAVIRYACLSLHRFFLKSSYYATVPISPPVMVLSMNQLTSLYHIHDKRGPH